jgi:probable HAF family extracellular repeat protein
MPHTPPLYSLLSFFHRICSQRAAVLLLVTAALLLHTRDVGRAFTTKADYLDDRDLGLTTHDLGNIIFADPKTDDLEHMVWGGRVFQGFAETNLEEAIKTIVDLHTRKFLTVSLQPTNKPDASGSGQNISRDGSCVVGYQDNGQFTPFHAFRTVGTAPVDLGTLDPANNASRSSFATDTNQDCSVVVGFSDVTAGGAIQHAFRWTSGNMVDLDAPANGGPDSRAFGVSSDGTVIVGDADFPDPNNLISGKSRKGFRWTQAGGFQNLGDFQPGGLSIATDVTGDGTVVVGQASTNSGSTAFRWVVPIPPAQPALQPIGSLPGHTQGVATAVSDNGRIVVGMSNAILMQYGGPVLGWTQGTAFRWTQATGTKDLRQILSDSGVDMTGVTLVSVTGMSPDGQWIGGQATTPQTGPNETVSFIAQICDDDIGGPCTTTGGGGTAPFTLGTSPTQLTVAAGQSANTTITVTPNAGFAQPVTFSCGGLPQGAACSFNPATVTPNGGAVNTTLTISTNGGAVALLSNTSPTMFAWLLTPIALFPVGMLLRRRELNRRLFSVIAGLIATLTFVGMLSCSGSDSSSPPPTTNSGSSPPPTGTPAGTSNVTVTASSGSGSTSVPVNLTVTR